MGARSGRCFYEVLEVDPQAQTQEIKSAYRRLALRYHPDKNQGDPSAKGLFQEIQTAYEALSQDDQRLKYDNTASFVRSSRSKRTWREPSYGPSHAYTPDPPFWSVELRAMTVQKCARIAKIQHLERQIQEMVTSLNIIVDADRAVKKQITGQTWFSFLKTRSSKANAQRHRDLMMKSECINEHLNKTKDELRFAHEDHRKRSEEDNERKTWWAKERIRRADEENRRAATTTAEAARRRAERAREHKNKSPNAAEETGQQAQEKTSRTARAANTEGKPQKRAESTREDPDTAKRRRREAQEWLARQREELLKQDPALSQTRRTIS